VAGLLYLWAGQGGVWAQVSQAPIIFPKVEQEEFFLQAIEAFDGGNTNAMIRLMDHAVAMDATNHFAYIKRAQLYDLIGQNAHAARDYTRALGSVGHDERYADVFQLRGCAFFKLGNLPAAVSDWVNFLQLKPDKEAEHWQICVAYALLGKYEDARRQFEWHWTVNAKDMEVAFWHFLCVARTEGLAAAREQLMEVEGEKRVPMPALYRLFKGEGSAAEVWLAVEEGNPNPDERNRREFFANYYLGLFRQAEGKLESANELIGAALEIAKSNAGYIGDSPGGQLRGGDIARVHHQQLQLQLADQRDWAKAQTPRDTLANKIAYVSAGIGLAALIGFGVVAQRRKRRRTRPETALEIEPEPEEPVEELTGKSST
jgi:lipoprotein NlpI